MGAALLCSGNLHCFSGEKYIVQDVRCSSSGVKLLWYHTSWQVSMLEEGTLYCVLRFGPHYFIMSKCKAVKHVKTYLSPVDVESFVRVCLGLGRCLHPC
jgi:hypothetical protein